MVECRTSLFFAATSNHCERYRSNSKDKGNRAKRQSDVCCCWNAEGREACDGEG